MESVANVTDIHEAMFFHVEEEVTRSNFGIWSLRWSPDGKEIIAGTGDSSLYIYDVESQRVGVLQIFPLASAAAAQHCLLLCYASLTTQKRLRTVPVVNCMHSIQCGLNAVHWF